MYHGSMPRRTPEHAIYATNGTGLMKSLPRLSNIILATSNVSIDATSMSLTVCRQIALMSPYVSIDSITRQTGFSVTRMPRARAKGLPAPLVCGMCGEAPRTAWMTMGERLAVLRLGGDVFALPNIAVALSPREVIMPEAVAEGQDLHQTYTNGGMTAEYPHKTRIPLQRMMGLKPTSPEKPQNLGADAEAGEESDSDE